MLKINLFFFFLTVCFIFLAPFAKPRITTVEVKEGTLHNAETLDQQIKITFSRPMDEKSVAQNVEVSPKFEYSTSWANNTFFMTPKLPLVSGEHYLLTVHKNVQDIYQRELAQDEKITFQTKNYQFVYLNRDNQLTVSGFAQSPQVITDKKNIKEYQVNRKKHSIVYFDQPTDEGETNIFSYDLLTQQTTQIPNQLHARLSNLQIDGTGEQLYFIADIPLDHPDQDVNGDPTTTQAKVFHYDLITHQQSESDLLQTFPTLVRFWITPEGNTFMVNDLSGELFLRAISGGKSVALGKYSDYRDGDFRGDKLIFIDSSQEYNYVQGIILYDGSTTRMTDVSEIAATPFLSLDGTLISYSFVPKNSAETAGQEGVKVINIANKKTLFEKYDSQYSFELSKLSADNKYLAVEEYNKDQLNDFVHIRKYGEPNKPDQAKIIFFDVQSWRPLPMSIEGKEFRWIN